jgi:hypothetical protein
MAIPWWKYSESRSRRDILLSGLGGVVLMGNPFEFRDRGLGRAVLNGSLSPRRFRLAGRLLRRGGISMFETAETAELGREISWEVRHVSGPISSMPRGGLVSI